ncbi:MAG: nitrilase-related carbon-nitrogen hydrolase [Bacteroidota bacterium]|nr:nitrilase-related carbon-nitrogen hydrolase [Bacteroidota bacterium]
MKYKIAVAQTDSVVGNLEKNVKHHIDYVKKAIAKKADIVVFPELSLTGYSIKDLNWETALRAEPNKYFSEFLKLSKQITIIIGAIEEAENYGIYNSAFLFEDNKVCSAHRKNYPPTYGMFEEMRYFSQGKDVRVFNSKFGKLGILICEDMWHISLPYILAHDGADVIISLTASPTRLSGTSEELTSATVNHEQHRAYARLLSTYIVFANRVGVEDGVNFWGGSQIVSPSGNSIAKAKLFGEDLIIAPIDTNEIRRARRFSRHFIDDSPEFTLQQLKNSLNRNSK